MTRYKLPDLMELMARLRDPETGCPWDLKQSYQSITSSTIEEVYEVVDTIERGDYPHLKEELGDLLFQVVFYSQLASEDGYFNLDDVVDVITTKLLRRHPHVFPDGTLASRREHGEISESHVNGAWESIKQAERETKGAVGHLDDVPKALPALTRATKLQKRAAQIGFDWPSVQGVVEKLDEELSEVKDALVQGETDAIAEEIGDLMFTCVNLSRHLKQDPEQILRLANSKFEGRFRQMEEFARVKGLKLEDMSSSELEAFWLRAKQAK